MTGDGNKRPQCGRTVLGSTPSQVYDSCMYLATSTSDAIYLFRAVAHHLHMYIFNRTQNPMWDSTCLTMSINNDE